MQLRGNFDDDLDSQTHWPQNTVRARRRGGRAVECAGLENR
jgi:hypothetical protein